jgi:hypothetical protein
MAGVFFPSFLLPSPASPGPFQSARVHHNKFREKQNQPADPCARDLPASFSIVSGSIF